MKNTLSSNAAMYERCKNVLKDLPSEVIDEIHSRIKKEFMSLPCRVEFLAEELNDLEEVKRKYVETGVLSISSLHNDSELLPGSINLAFRVWHDFVHIQFNYPFDYEGEYNTWKVQSKGLSYLARQVLYSEIVLQTAYSLHNGFFPKKQKVVLVNIENEL